MPRSCPEVTVTTLPASLRPPASGEAPASTLGPSPGPVGGGSIGGTQAQAIDSTMGTRMLPQPTSGLVVARAGFSAGAKWSVRAGPAIWTLKAGAFLATSQAGPGARSAAPARC